MKSYVKITRDAIPQLERTIKELADTRILVGIPHESAMSGREGSPISNAALGYIHNFGEPSRNIPQREFMAPGIESVLPELTARLRGAAEAGLDGEPEKMQIQLQAVGLLAQNAIKKRIQGNIPPPLAYATVLGRIRRRKSATWRKKRRVEVDANLAAGRAPAAGLFTALIDTGSLINAITYVLRKFSTGRDTFVGKFGKGT